MEIQGHGFPFALGALLAVAGGIAIALAVGLCFGPRGLITSQLPNVLLFGIPVAVYAVLRRRRQDEWNGIYFKLGTQAGAGCILPVGPLPSSVCSWRFTTAPRNSCCPRIPGGQCSTLTRGLKQVL